jgi:hypothetical protein
LADQPVEASAEKPVRKAHLVASGLKADTIHARNREVEKDVDCGWRHVAINRWMITA